MIHFLLVLIVMFSLPALGMDPWEDQRWAGSSPFARSSQPRLSHPRPSQPSYLSENLSQVSSPSTSSGMVSRSSDVNNIVEQLKSEIHKLFQQVEKKIEEQSNLLQACLTALRGPEGNIPPVSPQREALDLSTSGALSLQGTGESNQSASVALSSRSLSLREVGCQTDAPQFGTPTSVDSSHNLSQRSRRKNRPARLDLDKSNPSPLSVTGTTASSSSYSSSPAPKFP